MELRCRKRPRIDTPEKALRLTNECSTITLSEDTIANHFSCNGVNSTLGSDNIKPETGCMMLTITRFKHHLSPDVKLPSPLRAIGLTSPPDKPTKNGCLSQHNGYHGLPLVSANGLTAPVVKVNGFSSVVGHYISSESTQPSENGDSFCALGNRRILRAARTRPCDGIEVGGRDGSSWTDLKDGNGNQFSPEIAEACLGPKEAEKITTEIGKEEAPDCKSSEITSTDLNQQPRDIRKLSDICKDKSSSSSTSSLSSSSGFGSATSSSSTKDKATCQWNGCGEDIEVDALLEHITRTHVVSQAKAGADGETKFVCLWNSCKFYNRSSVLQTWLERHVLCHLGDKPYRCIVPHCRMRFASQFLLNRHINGHLDQSRPLRKGDTAAARQMKKRKLRNTKPCPVRTDDYFDSMTMESIQNELVRSTQLTQVDLLHSGNTITFHSSILAKRVDSSGREETLLRWTPRNLLPDQWVPESQAASYARQVIPQSTLPSDVLRMLTLPPRPNQGHSNRHRKNRRK